jgi:ferritin
MVDGQVKSVSQVTDILRYARIAGTDPAAMLSFDTFMAGQVPA